MIRQLRIWVFMLIMLTLGCGGLTLQSNPIWIDEAVITGEIDNQGKPVGESGVFSLDQPIIYCYVAGRGSDSIPVRLKWYYEDDLLLDQTISLGPARYNYGYIKLKPGKQWPLGKYRVEVGLVDGAIKTVEFSIEGPQS
ncbi:MAG: hypothetical protein JXM69_21380 [Anaerolineae bacterium]|nr:hypothetical protein [Anaerolineae bacterium]